MKFPRILHLRSAKFAPVAILSLFFVTNFTGLFFSPVFAPDVAASSVEEVETIPADIPVSGDCDLDWIIFRAGEREGDRKSTRLNSSHQTTSYPLFSFKKKTHHTTFSV